MATCAMTPCGARWSRTRADFSRLRETFPSRRAMRSQFT